MKPRRHDFVVNQLYLKNTLSSTPFLPIKISEKQVYAFYCLDQTRVNPKDLYLTGNVDDGTVGLIADINVAKYLATVYLLFFFMQK